MTTRTIGRYQILDTLGQGGMATVYRATDLTLNREVALKLLAAHLVTDSTFYQRFEREARTIAALEHPSIVPVYDFGIDASRQPYLVMRLLRGGTLRDRLGQGQLSSLDLWPTVRQVAAALDYAHTRDVVHRDIKPVNILFDEKGNAFVTDFGIAKVRDATTSDLTGNAVLGTPAYMSPEQFDNAPITGACDQYSLGVVLFEALTGRLPFGGGAPNVLMNKHLNETAPPAHTLNPALPPAVSTVLSRALAKDPATRFGTIAEFVQELEAASYQRGAAGRSLQAGRQQHLEGYYEAGRQAYQRTDWGAAVDFLGRVIAIDTGYRDAFKLHQTALYQLQRKRETATPSGRTIHPGAGGPTTDKARRPVNVRLVLVLSVIALAVVVFLVYLFWPVVVTPTPPPTPTVTLTAAPTEMPEAAAPTAPPIAGAEVGVLAAGDGASWESGGQTGPLAADESLPLMPGQPAVVTGGEDVTTLALPGGGQLFLESGADVIVTALEGGEIALQLRFGQALLQSGEDGSWIESVSAATAALRGAGLLGLNSERASLLFEAHCLAGACSLAGVNDEEALGLRAGQASAVGASGRAGAPERARYDLFESLAPDLVPEPTATPTPTVTATPIPPTATRVPPTVAPATYTPLAATVPPAPPTAPPPPPESPPTDTPEPPPTIEPPPTTYPGPTADVPTDPPPTNTSDF